MAGIRLNSEAVDVQTIKDHMSPERPLENLVYEKWMTENLIKYDSQAEANAAWEEHWARVESFLDWLANNTFPVLV